LAAGACFAQDSPKAENGGGGQIALYFKPWLALAADLQSYGSFAQCPNTGSEFTGHNSQSQFRFQTGVQFRF
jgi:hypothetical protein